MTFGGSKARANDAESLGSCIRMNDEGVIGRVNKFGSIRRGHTHKYTASGQRCKFFQK